MYTNLLIHRLWMRTFIFLRTSIFHNPKVIYLTELSEFFSEQIFIHSFSRKDE